MSKVQPIFIVGSNRTGTSITRNLVCRAIGETVTNFEPRLFLSYEPYAGVVIALWKLRFDVADAQRVRSNLLKQFVVGEQVKGKRQRGYGRHISKRRFCQLVDHHLHELEQGRGDKARLIHEFAIDLFAEYAIGAGGELSHIVDDTPSNLLCMKELLEIFPNAKFVHSIRDGRQVADSFVSKGWLRESWDLGLLTWYARTKTGRTIGQHIPAQNYKEFDFTTAFDDPEGYFKAVFEFLDLKLDPKHLAAFKSNRKRSNEEKRCARQQAKFEELASDLAREFGWN